MGCNRIPKIIEINTSIDRNNKQKLQDYNLSNISLSPNKGILLVEKKLDGIEEILQSNYFDEKKSILIWNYLIHHTRARNIDGLNSLLLAQVHYLEYYQREPKIKNAESFLSKTLKNSKWIFTEERQYKSVSEIFSENLNSRYERENASVFMHFLGIKSKFAHYNLTEEEMKWFLLGKKMAQNGITEKILEEVIEYMAKIKK